MTPLTLAVADRIADATLAEGRARLVLPAARLRRLGNDRKHPGIVALPVVDPQRIETLALRIDARIDAPVATKKR
jgi:GTP cyclohydrolase II